MKKDILQKITWSKNYYYQRMKKKTLWALCLCLFFPLYHYYYTTHCTSMMSSINIWSVFWFCYKVNAKLWILSRLDSSESWSFLDNLNFWKWLYEMSRLRIHLITLIYTKLQNSKKANKKKENKLPWYASHIRMLLYFNFFSLVRSDVPFWNRICVFKSCRILIWKSHFLKLMLP